MRRIFNPLLFFVFILNIFDAWISIHVIENVPEIQEVNRLVLFLHPFGASIIWYVKISAVFLFVVMLYILHGKLDQKDSYLSGCVFGVASSIAILYSMIVVNNVLLYLSV